MFIILVAFVFLDQINYGITANPWPTHKLMKDYKLMYPYQMREFVDLYNIPDCQCPRIYWPVCANDNVTYVNHCILNCHEKAGGIRRYGPCVHYRRDMDSDIQVVLPKTWKDSDSNAVLKVDPKDFIRVGLPGCYDCNTSNTTRPV